MYMKNRNNLPSQTSEVGDRSLDFFKYEIYTFFYVVLFVFQIISSPLKIVPVSVIQKKIMAVYQVFQDAMPWIKEEGIILLVLWDDTFGRGVYKSKKSPNDFMIDFL